MMVKRGMTIALINSVEKQWPGFSIIDDNGVKLCDIKYIKIKSGFYCVNGVVYCDEIRLLKDNFEKNLEKISLADDVVAPQSGGEANRQKDFALEASFHLGRSLSIGCLRQGEWTFRDLPQLSGPTLAGVIAKAFWQSLHLVGAQLPHVARALFFNDPSAKVALKRRLLGREPVEPHKFDSAIFLGEEVGASAEDLSGLEATIILPIYNGFELLPELLERVERNTDLTFRLILIEDASPDPRVRPYLRRWVSERGHFAVLLENEENLGFVGSVNRALPLALEDAGHAVLLNSDALVPKNWLSRLLRPIACWDRVASVTPMSNDAEILSVPFIGKAGPIRGPQVDLVDAVAQRLEPRAVVAELPTGVGFCMAMNIEYLRRIPQFDGVFGRGYGEEVDWCQKVAALGGRHLGVGNLFVGHIGGSSFGQAEKRASIERHGELIRRRYPNFETGVSSFIARDPLASVRLALGLAYADARARGPVNVFLAHSLGGGAERYLQRRIERELQQGRPSIVLRVGFARWRIELSCDHGILAGEADDYATVEKLLAGLRRRRVIYSCAVGASDPLQLPDKLIALKAAEGDMIEILFHDYFLLSPSFNLLDSQQRFRGVPPAADRDPAHQYRGEGKLHSLSDWRAAWGRLVAAADQLTVFSQDSRRLVLEAYPYAADKVRVTPHELHTKVPKLSPPKGHRVVIGILGNIGVEKGASVVFELAQEVARRRGLGMVVVGAIAPRFIPRSGCSLHGHYEVQEIPRIAAKYGVTCWLVPSICPETFSYTTHEALATGLPVFTFDLGAQAEAAQKAENGIVLDRAARGKQLLDLILHHLGERDGRTQD